MLEVRFDADTEYDCSGDAVPWQVLKGLSVPLIVIVAELQPKLQDSGNWKAAGIGGKKVLSNNQFAGLFSAASRSAGRALFIEQLYRALIAPLTKILLALDNAAGRIDEFDEKKQLARAASHVLFMLIPATKPGDECVPW